MKKGHGAIFLTISFVGAILLLEDLVEILFPAIIILPCPTGGMICVIVSRQWLYTMVALSWLMGFLSLECYKRYFNNEEEEERTIFLTRKWIVGNYIIVTCDIWFQFQRKRKKHECSRDFL